MNTRPLRILVTGSRAWTDARAVHRALIAAVGGYGEHLIVDGAYGPEMRWDRITLVHGACPRGVDRIAARFARLWRLAEERHPADWARHGRAAGPKRNGEMVAAGADICLAFPIGRSPGTRGCIELARAAGIPVVVHEGPSS